MDIIKLSQLPRTQRKIYNNGTKGYYSTSVMLPEGDAVVVVDKKLEIDSTWRVIFLDLNGKEIYWGELFDHKVFIVTYRVDDLAF